MDEFTALVLYNKLMGGLGYMLASLYKALGYFGIMDWKGLISSVAVHLAKHAKDKWQCRCKAMITDSAWTAATLQADSLVSTGVG